jgi:formate hydrogenlyase transcriptional activator
VEHTLDDDHTGEIIVISVEAQLLVEDGFQTAHHVEEIVGESSALKEVLRQMEILAPTGATLLIQGETGMGKERLRALCINSAPARPSPSSR